MPAGSAEGEETKKARRTFAWTGIGALTLAAVTAVGIVPAVAAPSQASLVPRHKVTYPTRETAHSRRQGRAASNASGSGLLKFGGGVDGIGVTTGAPKVYLVFWGSQWGTASTNGSGDTVLTGDPQGIAPRVQDLFKGVGANNETWSGVMTQYCEGVARGASSCPSSAAHVGYPTGGALGGVWVDTSSSSPSQATDHQIGVEAVNAAAHFGNTALGSNRNAQYVIVSPTGTHPGGFNTPSGNFCAWHDWNGDTTLIGGAVSSTYGDIAFTNMPYVTDLGPSCGAGYVNSPGTLDGVTIVEGHEYAETVTDQNPAGGWTDTVGYENGDKCAWVGTGGTGGAQNVAFSTGSFAMQATFSNDANACQIAHPIVTNGGPATNDFSLSASPTTVGVIAGSATNVTVSTAVTSGSSQAVALSATGVPSGVTASFNPASVTAGATSTLSLSAAANAPTGTSTITITGTAASGSHSATLTLTVSAAGGTSAITNGGFETGTLTGWSTSGSTSVVSSGAYQGTFAAQVGSTSPSSTSRITQNFTAPSGTSRLSVAYDIFCNDTAGRGYATVTLRDNTTGRTTTVLPRTCTLGAGWSTASASVTVGHSYTLTLTNRDDNRTSDPGYTWYDAVSVA